MNLALATGPLAQAIGWALLHLLWQGALVALGLAVALALLAGRSANLRYVLSCAALGLVVLLGVGTGIRSYEAAPAPASATRIVTAAPSSGAVDAASPATDDRLGDLARAASDALPLLVTLWLAGVAVFSCRLVVEWFRARRLVERSAAPASELLQATARRLGAALGVRRVVRLVESTAVLVPSVIGLARPVILLPASTLAGLTPVQLEMILAHELAHIRRHDFLVNLLQSVVETLLFYHPAVWWISRRVRDERENCCDDLAVAVCGNPLLYARTLTRLEELCGPAPALAAPANGGSLFERVRRIAGGPARSTSPVVRGAVALSALTCVVVALAAMALPAIGAKKSKGVMVHALAPAAPGAPEAPAEPAPPSPKKVAAIVGVPVEIEATLRELDRIETSLVAAAGDDEEVAVEEPDPAIEAASDDAKDDGKPTLDELIALKVHGVTPERIREVRALFPKASLEDIASMSAVGATPEFVREMRRAGITVESAEDACGLAGVGVTPQFVRGMLMAGIKVESADEATGLAGVGVTPDYVRRMRRAGVDLKDAEGAQSLRALNVTPEFVARLAKAGYRGLSVEQLQRLGASGVTGDFIEEMSKYRSR